MNKIDIIICLGSSCFSKGNGKILPIIKRFIADNCLEEQVDFRGELCSGNCQRGPHIRINDEFIYNVSEENIIAVLNEHLLKTED